jgi:serine phosphatase RsbU (regulator of sigma subunit)
LIDAAQNLQARSFPDLISLAVIDQDSRDRLRIERLQAMADSNLRDNTNDVYIGQSLRFGQISYSPIALNSAGKASFLLTMPIRNDAGTVTGALQAEIAAEPIAVELRAAGLNSISYVYLVNETDNTYLNSDGVPGQTTPPQLSRLLAEQTETGQYVGARSQEVVGAIMPVKIGDTREQTGWIMVAERPADGAFASIRWSVLLLTTLVILVGGLALVWALRQARSLLAPIDALRTGAATLGSGRLDHRIVQVGNDELGDVARAFNQMAGHLQESLAEIASQNERLRRGLALARDIQIGLLPETPPWRADTVAVAARSIPAYEVGGDFYTYVALSEGRAAIAIGDISGKGIGAALLMALTSSTVESQGRLLEHPATVLSALNHLLAPRLRANHMNAALLFAVFDPRQATVRMANAGMIAPMLISTRGNHFMNVSGLPLGTYSEARYHEEEMTLQSGDMLLLISDGVVEAHDPQGNLFGFERLEALIDDLQPNDVHTLVELVLKQVQEHIGTAEQHDDITIVAIHPQILTVTPTTNQEQAIDYAII